MQHSSDIKLLQYYFLMDKTIFEGLIADTFKYLYLGYAEQVFSVLPTLVFSV